MSKTYPTKWWRVEHEGETVQYVASRSRLQALALLRRLSESKKLPNGLRLVEVTVDEVNSAVGSI